MNGMARALFAMNSEEERLSREQPQMSMCYDGRAEGRDLE
jgi:hypothetical protein